VVQVEILKINLTTQRRKLQTRKEPKKREQHLNLQLLRQTFLPWALLLRASTGIAMVVVTPTHPIFKNHFKRKQGTTNPTSNTNKQKQQFIWKALQTRCSFKIPTWFHKLAKQSTTDWFWYRYGYSTRIDTWPTTVQVTVDCRNNYNCKKYTCKHEWK